MYLGEADHGCESTARARRELCAGGGAHAAGIWTHGPWSAAGIYFAMMAARGKEGGVLAFGRARFNWAVVRRFCA